MVKDAVNRQGQGWEYDFTIDSAYKAKVLQISFDYIVNSGTFTAGTSSADSDVTVWIYDVMNAQVIQPSSYKLLSNSSTISSKHTATFQTASNSTSYRLIFHVATTSASAYTLKVDGVSVSPSTYVYGSPVTDWQSYTPTVVPVTGTLTNATASGKWRRDGDTIHVMGKLIFSAASSAFSGLNATLPSGLSIDSTKLLSGAQSPIGITASLDSGVANYVGGNVFVTSSTSVALLPAAINTHTGTAPVFSPGYSNTFPITFAANDEISWEFMAPVTGWGASVQMSSETDTRVVAASAYYNASLGVTSGTAIPLNTVNYDTHGALTLGSGRFTAPVSGFHRISLNNWARSSGSSNTIIVYKNGSIWSGLFSFSAALLSHSGSMDIYLNAGDYVDLRTDGAYTLNSGFNVCFARLSGPSAIAATETVAAIYQTSAGQSIPFNVETVVVFGTKIYDSHSAMNSATGIYTCPVSGEYEVSGGIYFGSAITATATDVQFLAYKNGAAYLGINNPKSGTAATPMTTSGTIKVRCNAGDTLSVAVKQNNSASTAQALISSAAFNWVSITRVGN